MSAVEQSQPQQQVPCRLYVLLAREAPVGVIFRRGPSKWVQIIHWDTTNDTLNPGQWFHGRIYEKRSDLSPDAKLLVYAARKGIAYPRRDADSIEAWTAISKPPYLTALALWPCYGSVGGGIFLSDTAVWLNDFADRQPHPDHRPKGLTVSTDGKHVVEEVVLNRRLERDGWRLVQPWQGAFIENAWWSAYQERRKANSPTDSDWMRSVAHLDNKSGYVTQTPSMREKPHPAGGFTLVMTTSKTGYEYHYVYSVRNGNGQTESLAGVEWAEWDQQGRLVFAREGKLFAAIFAPAGLVDEQELSDFNGNKFEATEAPDWAKVW